MVTPLQRAKPEAMELAIAQWSRIVGADGIQTASQILPKYSGSTGLAGTRPAAVLFPRATQEVVEVVRVAHEFRIPLYPISKGNNWGYGDACAPTDGQVIVDLSRMNRILEVNVKLGYAVIEPGVTQGQLWEYLDKNKTGLWMDATGAGPDTSFVGNFCERGFGHTRYGDHFQTSCGLEVVLADGRVLDTGFGHFQEAKAQFLYRYGVGPVLDGLFSQSNFGIITRMGLWLMPEPEAFCAFFFSCPHEKQLREVIDLLAPLRLQGELQSAIHIANDLRVLSSQMRYPSSDPENITPLPNDLRRTLRKKYGIGEWNGCGTIAGSKRTVQAIKRDVKAILKPFKPIFLSDKTLTLAEKAVKLLPAMGLFDSLRSKVNVVRPTFDMLKGKPVTYHLSGACWRVKPKTSQVVDPIEEGAGLIWISPILPLEGEQAEFVFSLLSPLYAKHGFETLITFTLLTERSIVCISNISFDRSNAEETKRAGACYTEIFDTLAAHGYYSYRTGPLGYKKLGARSTQFWDVVEALKRTLDPHSIISPGRYLPEAATRSQVAATPSSPEQLR